MLKNRKGFLWLLERYQKGTGTSGESEMMDIWYDSIHHEHQEGGSDLTDEELKKQMWLELRSGMHREEKVYPFFNRKRWWQADYYKITAACALLVVAFIFYRSFQSTFISGISDSQISGLVKTANSTSAVKEVLLSDGSRITLYPGAVLFHPDEFDHSNRIVYLKGNGRFDVAKDAERPFLVYTDEIVTKVLGTSFTIQRDKESGVIEVSVITGKVVVEKTAESSSGVSLSTKSGVVLTPNRKVSYYTESEQYVPGLIAKPQIIEKGDEYLSGDAFSFTEIPLSTVLAKLEKAYGVEIAVSNERVKDCVITANLSQDDLYGKLEVICAAVNAQYEVKEGRIFLSGQGCTLRQ